MILISVLLNWSLIIVFFSIVLYCFVNILKIVTFFKYKTMGKKYNDKWSVSSLYWLAFSCVQSIYHMTYFTVAKLQIDDFQCKIWNSRGGVGGSNFGCNSVAPARVSERYLPMKISQVLKLMCTIYDQI